MTTPDARRMPVRFVEEIQQHIRLALRLARRAPGATATIALTLALGIGANAAIFGIVNGLLLRPLPVANPHRLVTVSSESALARGYTSGFGWTRPMWTALQPHVALFEGATAWTPAQFDLAGHGERQLVDGIFASGGYFTTLGVQAVRGRTFTTSDDSPGGGADGPVAVISYGLWQRRFGGAEHVIGAPLDVNGITTTIVGVTEPRFTGVDVGRTYDVTLPLATEPLVGRAANSRPWPLIVMLRLKANQSIEAGTTILRGLQPQVLGVTVERMSTVEPARYREPFTLASAATGTSLPVRGPLGLRQSYQRPLLTILAVALLVLLIACVNIANLLLARTAARRYELGVRLALGASRARLARQLLIESALLAVPGTIAGFLMAQWISRALVAQLSTPAERMALDVAFDWRVLAFTAAVGCATALACGLAPALGAARVAPLDVLKVGNRTLSTSSGRRRLATPSSGLVVAQITLSLALVIAAALFVRSFARLSDVPLGFDPDRVLVVNVDTARSRTEPAARRLLFQRIVEAAGGIPGVARAGGSIWTPVDGGLRLGDPESRVAFNFVTPGWFAAYGTALREGRDFTFGDTARAQPVIIVNEAFVRKHMQGRSPIGSTYPHSRGRQLQRTIVGVVDDAIFDSQREGIHPIAYLPVAQSGAFGPSDPTEISIGVRPHAGPPMQLASAVADALQRVDPNLSFTFQLLTDHVQASVRQERLVAVLSGFFGALALTIAAIGLYAVTSYTVSRRVVEIGIRRALGAQPLDVVGLVVRQSMVLTAIGIGLGLVAAAAGTRYLEAMLFGLTPLDPATFVGVAVLFAAVAATASSIAALRAVSIEPMVAVRSE